MKLPAHRVRTGQVRRGLPGKEISFWLCPLIPPTRRGLRGTCRSTDLSYSPEPQPPWFILLFFSEVKKWSFNGDIQKTDSRLRSVWCWESEGGDWKSRKWRPDDYQFKSYILYVLSNKILNHSIFEIQINACDLSGLVDKSGRGGSHGAGHGADRSTHEDGHWPQTHQATTNNPTTTLGWAVLALIRLVFYSWCQLLSFDLNISTRPSPILFKFKEK